MASSKPTKAQLAALVESGLSDGEIAARLDVHRRTVVRWRQAADLPSHWHPAMPDHGTSARYERGCRCTACRRANADKQATKRRRAAYRAWQDDNGP